MILQKHRNFTVMCLDGNLKRAVVATDFNEGVKRGVRGTPTFFINGQVLQGAVTFEDFKAMIDPILQ